MPGALRCSDNWFLTGESYGSLWKSRLAMMIILQYYDGCLRGKEQAACVTEM